MVLRDSPSYPGTDKEAEVERGTMPGGMKEPSGWIVFAGVMLLLVGFMTIIDGLVALFNSGRYLVPEKGLVVADFTTWGWVMVLLGIALVLVGFGLMAERGWARWIAIFLVLLNALNQIAFVNVTPIWSLVVIGIDIIILYQLTMNWKQAEYAAT